MDPASDGQDLAVGNNCKVGMTQKSLDLEIHLIFSNVEVTMETK